jgi:hypothetical protein
MIPRETILLPTLWDAEEVCGQDGWRALEWLVGTEAEKQLQRKDGEGLSLVSLYKRGWGADDQEALRSYHSTLDLPPTSEHPDQSTFPTFLYAYSMVSSRGFALDTYHLIGLIPFCDMFNHSSSTPHTSLSVDSNVCEECGSLLQCEHDNGTNSERLKNLSPEYLAKLEEDGMADMVDMRVQRDVKSGEQVFSCYDDEHADAELMVEYGFIEGGNTAITWSYRDFLNPKHPETTQRFMALLQRTPQPSDDNQEDTRLLVGPPCRSDRRPEPLVIRPNGEISRSLAIILFNATANDERNVDQIGDDLDMVIQNLNCRNNISNPEQSRLANEVCGLIEKRLTTFLHSGIALGSLRKQVGVSRFVWVELMG